MPDLFVFNVVTFKKKCTLKVGIFNLDDHTVICVNPTLYRAENNKCLEWLNLHEKRRYP